MKKLIELAFEIFKTVILLLVLIANIYIIYIYVIQDKCCFICQLPDEKCLEEMRFVYLLIILIDFFIVLGSYKSLSQEPISHSSKKFCNRGRSLA